MRCTVVGAVVFEVVDVVSKHDILIVNGDDVYDVIVASLEASIDYAYARTVGVGSVGPNLTSDATIPFVGVNVYVDGECIFGIDHVINVLHLVTGLFEKKWRVYQGNLKLMVSLVNASSISRIASLIINYGKDLKTFILFELPRVCSDRCERSPCISIVLNVDKDASLSIDVELPGCHGHAIDARAQIGSSPGEPGFYDLVYTVIDSMKRFVEDGYSVVKHIASRVPVDTISIKVYEYGNGPRGRDVVVSLVNKLREVYVPFDRSVNDAYLAYTMYMAESSLLWLLTGYVVPARCNAFIGYNRSWAVEYWCDVDDLEMYIGASRAKLFHIRSYVRSELDNASIITGSYDFYMSMNVGGTFFKVEIRKRVHDNVYVLNAATEYRSITTMVVDPFGEPVKTMQALLQATMEYLGRLVPPFQLGAHQGN